jgi:hypothetical protein
MELEHVDPGLLNFLKEFRAEKEEHTSKGLQQSSNSELQR